MTNRPGDRRLLLRVAYDGRPFAGWQSQRRAETVQDRLETALAGVAGRAIRVHGAGRTDAGVHALAQVAHCDVPASLRMTPVQWTAALNSKLPASIRVLGCRRVPDGFHARYNARGKVYRYEIFRGPVLPPLKAGLAWQVRGGLDIGRLREGADLFQGRHDFRNFAANRGKGTPPPRTTERTLREVRVLAHGNRVAVTLSGDGFLYKMARLITGTLARFAQDKLTTRDLLDYLECRSQGKSAFCAPPDGLYLVRVEY